MTSAPSFTVKLSPRIEKQLIKLQKDQDLIDEIQEALIELVKSYGQPHLHTGLGIQKLHSKGYREFRVGLDKRVVFHEMKSERTLYLDIIGNHDDVQKFLKIAGKKNPQPQ